MNNCVLTKYGAVANNDNLDYLDYLHINVRSVESPSANNFSIGVQTTSAKTITIEGDGHFTDGTMAEDRGKTANVNNSAVTNLKYSNGSYKIKIPLTGLVAFTAGSSALHTVSDWQVDGFKFDRLIKQNVGTLQRVTFKNADDLLLYIPYTKDVIAFSALNNSGTTGDYQPIMEALVEQSGRSANFSIEIPNMRDFYGAGNNVRNIHIESATRYSVYNGANTTELYVGEKINGVWNYTLAE